MHAGKKKKICPAFASELCACVLGHILNGYQDILTTLPLLTQNLEISQMWELGAFLVFSEDVFGFFLPSSFPVEALQTPCSSKHLASCILFQDSLGYLIVCPNWYPFPQAAVTSSFAVKCFPLSYFSVLSDFLVKKKNSQSKTKKHAFVLVP